MYRTLQRRQRGTRHRPNASPSNLDCHLSYHAVRGSVSFGAFCDVFLIQFCSVTLPCNILAWEAMVAERVALGTIPFIFKALWILTWRLFTQLDAPWPSAWLSHAVEF